MAAFGFLAVRYDPGDRAFTRPDAANDHFSKCFRSFDAVRLHEMIDILIVALDEAGQTVWFHALFEIKYLYPIK